MNEVMSKELATKLFNVFSKTEGLVKDLSVGKGINQYKAVGEKAVLNMLKPLLKEQKLIIIPKDGDINENILEYIDGYGKNKLRAITQLKVYFTIVDCDTGEGVDIVGFGNGADSQDKGSGKAFTYAFKGALQKTFMSFSGEDTDNTHSDDIGKDKAPKESVKGLNYHQKLNEIDATYEEGKISHEDVAHEMKCEWVDLYNVTEKTKQDAIIKFLETKIKKGKK